MNKKFNKEEFINKTVEWLKQWEIQEFPGAPVERYIDDDMISNYIRYMEEV
jgi:hypothetical protein